jgi:thiol-disulfide isomerase/thioredoxin
MRLRGRTVAIMMFCLVGGTIAFALDVEPWPAPDFSVTDLEGNTVSLSDFRGSVVIVHFWATWCTSCRNEMPLLEDFSRTYEPRSVYVLAVTSERDEERVRDFFDCLIPYYKVLLDKTSQIRQAYGIRGLPVTLVVDRSGRVVKQYNGKQDWKSEELLADIETLIRD